MKPRSLQFSHKIYILTILFTLAITVLGILILLPGSSERIDQEIKIVSMTTPSSSASDDLKYASQIHDFIKTNGDCELPCWLGIRAGETTITVVQDKYSSALGVSPKKITEKVSSKDRVPYYVIHSYDSAYGLSISYEFRVGNDDIITEAIGVIHSWQRTPDSYYAQVMRSYLLSSILNNMGVPDQVWVNVETHRWDSYTGEHYYQVTLNYSMLGFWVQYQGDLKENATQYYLCPVKGMTVMIGQWWSPTNTVAAASPTANFPVSGSPLEQATKMNIATFYKIFLETNSQVCLETPVDMWK